MLQLWKIFLSLKDQKSKQIFHIFLTCTTKSDMVCHDRALLTTNRAEKELFWLENEEIDVKCANSWKYFMVNLITIVTAYIQTSQNAYAIDSTTIVMTETNVISGDVIVGDSSFNYWQTVQTLIRLLQGAV